MSFAEAVGPRVDGGSCPHMAVVLRSGRELPAVLVSFYALGARRGGWVVHHACPTQCDRDRERLTAAGLDVGDLEARRKPRALRVRSRRGARGGGRALRAAAGRRARSAATARCGTRASRSGPGATDFANATAYDRAWDARFRGRPVVTLCPYVLAGEDAGERIAHLDGWHDAVLDAEGRRLPRPS